LRRLVQQFACDVQVNLRRDQTDMPHISAQQRQAGLDIATVAIPTQKTMDREGVAKVV
jgi:hypothetical protein